METRDRTGSPELFQRALDAPSDDERWADVHELQRRGTRDILERAIALSASPETRERELAADVLGQLGFSKRLFLDESVGALIELLERDEDPRVLRAAAVALHHRRDPRAVESLAALSAHPDPDVRKSVAFGLRDQADRRAVRALIKLSEDAEPAVRDWATFGLRHSGLELAEITDALERRLHDDDANVRREATMGALARGRSTAELADLALAGQRLEDADGGWDAVEEDRPAEPRRLALLVLHERANDEVFKAASDLCHSDEPAARRLGVRIIRELGSSRARPDAPRPFRDRAVTLLAKMATTEQDPDVLLWVASALGYQNSLRALDPLLALASHPNTDVRYAVADALLGCVETASEADPRTMAALATFCSDPEEAVRWSAVYDLSEWPELDSPEIRRSLTERLDDPQEEIRSLATRALRDRSGA